VNRALTSWRIGTIQPKHEFTAQHLAPGVVSVQPAGVSEWPAGAGLQHKLHHPETKLSRQTA
jgi:hypothetical protein